MNHPGDPQPDGAVHSDSTPLYAIALKSDLGTNRETNEDSCGCRINTDGTLLFAVADGIGGYEGGEVASAMAIAITLDAYCTSPREWGPAKRLNRAVQRANIEIHNKALTIPELRRMGTTLTAVVIDNGTLHAAHVGDCRLYLVRRGKISQLTKDHTVVQERVRMGLMTAARARRHPERSALSRSVGHELIVSVDRITLQVEQNDRLLLCSDGLYNVLEEHELASTIFGHDAESACKALVEMANHRGTADNLTAAVFTMKGASPAAPPIGIWRRLATYFRR